MRDFRDAKAMAHSLREALKGDAVEVSHSKSLELIAKCFGYDNWNVLSAKIEAGRPRAIDAAEPSAAREPVAPKILHCSFCGKSQHDVRTLVAGPSVFICDECVELCVDIVRDGALWKVLSLLRAKQPGETVYQAAFEHVRSKATEEVASYVEQSRNGVQRNRDTLRLIERRLATRDDGGPHDEGLTLPPFAHLNMRTKEELEALQTSMQRELVHYEDALRIGTTVLDERGRRTVS